MGTKQEERQAKKAQELKDTRAHELKLIEAENKGSETDIFHQQEKTIDTLYDVMQRQQSETTQPTYVTPIQQSKSAPNYLLWLAIGAGAIWLLKG